MLHPSRRHNVARIARSCAPLRLQLAMDPEPAAAPSPLRTAKIAWTAVADGATHHLIVQDDVVLAVGFASQLEQLIKRWPRHAIALYVNWNSPYNSYRVRCAVMAGRSWAPMPRWEWVPTLGVVLPADHARGVAAFMQTLPDSFKSDDWAVANYCQAHDIPMLAAVPHLLEHGDDRSAAGNEWAGPRRATVTGDLLALPDDYWDAAGANDDGTEQRPEAVALYKSRCYLKHWYRDDEPSLNIVQPDGTDWAQRCTMFGIPRSIIDATFAGRRTPPGPDTSIELEFWVAGLMLGADVGRLTGGVPLVNAPAFDALRHEAMRTWVSSGLDSQDAGRLGQEGQQLLVQLLLEAAENGRTLAL